MTKAYAAYNSTSPLAPIDISRRTVLANDVEIEILYCGVCHSDLHQVRNEWNGTIYPVVPGHEIVGRVTQIGNAVTKFKVGDIAGVGCFVDSCRHCEHCKEGLEQYCSNGMTGTYNNMVAGADKPTYGGYSSSIVVDENYTLTISDKLDLKAVAPLLCAGITTYSPLRHWKVGKGTKLGVLGLGGLGHMAVKLGVAFGAEVTVLSSSHKKEADAKALGAHQFIAHTDANELLTNALSLDIIINTVSAPHDMNAILNLLKVDGTMVLLGAPPTPAQIMGFSLIGKRRTLAGSLIGGIKETQEMLDFCAAHNIVSEIELIAIQDINEAYERMLKSDVKYRFVIDMKTL